MKLIKDIAHSLWGKAAGTIDSDVIRESCISSGYNPANSNRLYAAREMDLGYNDEAVYYTGGGTPETVVNDVRKAVERLENHAQHLAMLLK